MRRSRTLSEKRKHFFELPGERLDVVFKNDHLVTVELLDTLFFLALHNGEEEIFRPVLLDVQKIGTTIVNCVLVRRTLHPVRPYCSSSPAGSM